MAPKDHQDILMFEAIGRNDFEKLKVALESGANPNSKENFGDGHTPLGLACCRQYYECAKLLLDAGANVDNAGPKSETPLKLACDAYGSPPVDRLVELLLRYGANPEKYQKGSDGPLHYAAMFNQFGALKLLVEHKADVNRPGAYKRTPLIYAASSAASAEMVRFLIDHGADIHAKNAAGENALFELITQKWDDPEVARVLLDSGISPNSKCKQYDTVLHWAAFCGRTKIAELLVKRGADMEAEAPHGNTPILKAMSQNKMETVKLLFTLGADPLSKNKFGFSLLEYASDKGDHNFVKAILTKIDNKKADSSGAMASAAQNGDLQMLKILFKAGYPIDDRNTNGNETPLIKAAYHGQSKAVDFLLEHGAEIKAIDWRGNTALLHAAYNGHTIIVKTLLEHGAHINERNNLNWNALMQACIGGHFDTAQYLLEHGSPTDEIDKEKGVTALTLAKTNGSRRLIELLESFGGKERLVRMRRPAEVYFSIFDCEICHYLPDRKDLGRTEQVENFYGLNEVYSDYTHPDRYCDKTHRILKCFNCGTYYYQFHSIDTEDAFVGGPSITHQFQRINLVCLKALLKEINLRGESAELGYRYEDLIQNLLARLNRQADMIIENHLCYVIESVSDYFIKKNDWSSLKKYLLEHSKTKIGIKTAHDLVVMYGEKSYKWFFPPFTNYKSISEEFQNIFKPFFQPHFSEFKKIVENYQVENNEYLWRMLKSLIDSMKYYKI